MVFQTLKDYKTSGFVLLHASQNAFMILYQSHDCARISLPQHVFAYFAKALSVSCLGTRYQHEYKYEQLRNKTVSFNQKLAATKANTSQFHKDLFLGFRNLVQRAFFSVGSV